MALKKSKYKGPKGEPILVDEDLRSPEELRGDMKQIASAKLSMAEMATVEGVRTEITVLKQQMETTHEQMRRLIGMYQTLRGEYDVFQAQRLKELNVGVNGGSTTPEDI